MTRALRIQFKGAWHHVMNRGAERKPIFTKDYQSPHNAQQEPVC